MTRALSWPTLLWVYLLFLVRLGGWETERLEAWREVVLVAIPKKTDKGFRAMRYISLFPVLQKFYVRALQTAVRRERRPHEKNIRGFEPGRSTAGVTGTLRHRFFLQKGVHPEAVCAPMRESFDLQGRISLPGAPVSPEFDYARGTRQGSVDGPDSWNQVLDNALRELAARWGS